jgi:hypothetical protein
MATAVPAIHISYRVFAHGAKIGMGRELSALQGGFLLLLFFDRQKKSKNILQVNKFGASPRFLKTSPYSPFARKYMKLFTLRRRLRSERLLIFAGISIQIQHNDLFPACAPPKRNWGGFYWRLKEKRKAAGGPEGKRENGHYLIKNERFPALLIDYILYKINWLNVVMKENQPAGFSPGGHPPSELGWFDVVTRSGFYLVNVSQVKLPGCRYRWFGKRRIAGEPEETLLVLRTLATCCQCHPPGVDKKISWFWVPRAKTKFCPCIQW